MNKLLIIGVNYQSYSYIKPFLQSIDTAAEKEKNMEVDVVIADNSAPAYQEIGTSYAHIRVHVEQLPNLGYLGSAGKVWSEVKDEYDAIAISNVDLEMDPDFFTSLNEIDTKNTAWLAPDIYTPRTGTHENPNMVHRPSKYKFWLWIVLYSCPMLYHMYHRLYRIRHKQALSVQATGEIYSGHGSFMLLTKAFKDAYPRLNYPCFMYGEEIFLAELIREMGLKVVFVPQMKIRNVGNISVNQLPSNQVFKWCKESVQYLYQQFFR